MVKKTNVESDGLNVLAKKIKTKKSGGKSTSSSISGNKTGDNEIKPLRYTLSENHSSIRHLFLKRNLASLTSLIVGNIPSFLDIDIVKLFITQFAPSTISCITNARSSAVDGSLEYGQISLTFEMGSENAVNVALQKCETVGPYKASDFGFASPAPFMKKSVSKYSSMFMDADELQERIDVYMQHHDQQVLEAKREARRKFTEPDEEGWITVTKASKKIAKTVKLKKSDIPLTGGLHKKKKESGGSFYTFQGKESKLKKANELQAKFNEDRKRIEHIRKSRSFNPY